MLDCGCALSGMGGCRAWCLRAEYTRRYLTPSGVADISGLNGCDGDRPADFVHELDTQRFRRVHIDHSAGVPGLEAVLRKVTCQNHDVRHLKRHGHNSTVVGGLGTRVT